MDFVSNMVSAATGTIELRADFPNADMRLVPGQTVTVAVAMNQIAGAMVVPRDAVNLGPDSSFVLVVGKDGKAYSKTVKVLNDDGANDAIQGDVKPGDKVVTEGQLRVDVRPGRCASIKGKRRAASRRRAAMNISAPFIERPVMTMLLMAALVIFGLFGYAALAGQRIAGVDFPTITVSASLPGADPETMASAVATPLENANSPPSPASTSMTSQARQGTTIITLQFDLDRDIDGAAEDVQAAIQAASRQLPVNMPQPAHLAQGQSGRRADPVPGAAVRHHAAL